MLLEILAEEGLRREVQVVGDLLDAHARILQQGLCLEDHRFVDPPGGGLAAHLLDHRGEVFGRDVELLGIEAHVPLLLVVTLEQRHELVEKHLTAPLLDRIGPLALVDLGDDIEGRGEERANDLVAVALLVAAQHRLDHLEQLPDLLDVLRRHGKQRGLAETHVDGQRSREIDLDLIDERLREGQKIGRSVRRTFDRADDAVGIEEDDRVGPHLIGLHVDRDGGLACHHDDGRKSVDRRRIVGRRVVLC